MLANIDQSNEPPKQFTFDAVYAEDSITETLYADSVFPLVESVGFFAARLSLESIVLPSRFSKVTTEPSLRTDRQGR